jgi:hypothetical protein
LFKGKVVVVACVLCLFLLATARVQSASFASSASSAFLISPSPVTVGVNGNVTVTVNVTNAENLAAWQIILKYNGTGLKLNSLWVPDDSVFAGHRVDFLPVRFAVDAVDGSSASFTGASLFGLDSVNVSNGVICKANFAVLCAGQWSIVVADISNPLHMARAGGSAWDPWYSCWMSTPISATQNTSGSDCTVFAVNEVVTGKQIGPIMPLNSTSFLGLENFTISSSSNISSLSFDPSISQLSFKGDTSDFDVLNITLPSSIVENTSLVITVNLDGESCPHYDFGSSTIWSICLDQGVHVVTLNISWIDPPPSVPEFSLLTILTSLAMLTLFALALCRKRRMSKAGAC